MDKRYKIGDKVLVRGIVNSEVSNGGIHILHDGVDAFYTLDQIDEPQKAVVPKVVAEWLNGCKRSGWHLRKVIFELNADEKVGNWAYDENDYLIPEKVDMIARAWLDGCEIEREKLYTVEVVGTGQYLVERYKKQGYVFIDTEDPLLFTKSELEAAGFGWVFDCEGVKVEEVE